MAENGNEQEGAGQIISMRLETRNLIDRMRLGKPGDKLTDEALSEITEGKSCSVGGQGYGYLQSAIRHCEREHNVVWRRIRGANAIECLDWEKRLQVGSDTVKHVHKQSRRAVQVASGAELNGLSDNEKGKAMALVAQLGTISLFTMPSARKKLEARNIKEPVTMQRLLEAFPKS